MKYKQKMSVQSIFIVVLIWLCVFSSVLNGNSLVFAEEYSGIQATTGNSEMEGTTENPVIQDATENPEIQDTAENPEIQDTVENGETQDTQKTLEIQANPENSVRATGESGGIIIETEKVDGSLSLLPILLGKVHIYDGLLYGLTITKKIETGEGLDPFVIRIKSEGPISVKNLYAETIGNSIPEFSGLCLPGKLGWLCMKNVKMTVSEQSVSAISLPSATVETCFESECGPLPDENTMSSEEMKDMLKELEEQSQSLMDIESGLIENEKQLSSIQANINNGFKLLEKIKKEEKTIKLNELLEAMTKILKNEPVNIDSVEDFNQDGTVSSEEQLFHLTKQFATEYELYDKKTEEFFSLVDSTANMLQNLESSLRKKEESLARHETEKEQTKNDEQHQQAELYQDLIEEAEKTQSTDSNESQQEKGTNDKEPDIAQLKQKLNELQTAITQVKQSMNDLLAKKEAVKNEKDSIVKSITSIKEQIEKGKKNYSEEVYLKIMENLKDFPLEPSEPEQPSEEQEEPTDPAQGGDNQSEPEQTDEQATSGEPGTEEIEGAEQEEASQEQPLSNSGVDQQEPEDNGQEKDESTLVEKTAAIRNDEKKKPRLLL